MEPGSHAALAGIRDSLLETYASNDAMNQLILTDLDPRAWRAAPPGKKGSGRTIAAIFAHLHNEASRSRAQKKRRAVPAHANGCPLGLTASPRGKILARQLGADMARRRDHVRLHVLARSPPSRPDPDAGSPTRLPFTRQNSWRLALGEALERIRPHHSPTLNGTSAPKVASLPSRPFAARGGSP
jgi:hypothetical protein